MSESFRLAVESAKDEAQRRRVDAQRLDDEGYNGGDELRTQADALDRWAAAQGAAREKYSN